MFWDDDSIWNAGDQVENGPKSEDANIDSSGSATKPPLPSDTDTSKPEVPESNVQEYKALLETGMENGQNGGA